MEYFVQMQSITEICNKCNRFTKIFLRTVTTFSKKFLEQTQVLERRNLSGIKTYETLQNNDFNWIPLYKKFLYMRLIERFLSFYPKNLNIHSSNVCQTFKACITRQKIFARIISNIRHSIEINIFSLFSITAPPKFEKREKIPNRSTEVSIKAR